MYWNDTFFYDTTNVADTWETIATSLDTGKSDSISGGTVLQHFTVNNKHSAGITFNAKLVYLHSDGVTTTEIMLSEDVTLATTKTYNFLNFSDTLDDIVWATPGTLSVPSGSYIQVKSSVINSMDIICTLRSYSQGKFDDNL
tara:strand:- start:9044 stop:9469 length:426 start_codon:yes stop_codon:yes gene_type:complete